MPHAADIISIFEGALRILTNMCDAAAAATAAAGAAPIAAAGALELLHRHAGSCFLFFVVSACYPAQKVLGPQPLYPSPLVLLAIAAGPGSQVKQQLHSLLATMVKLSVWGKGKLQYVEWLGFAAAHAAAALLSSAAGKQQPQPQQGVTTAAAAAAAGGIGCSSSPAAAVVMLPSVAILGHCCMQWAKVDDTSTLLQEQQPEPCSSQEQQQLEQQLQQQQQQQEKVLLVQALNRLVLDLLAVVQWLAAGSTYEQLAAAGYDPLPVVQQLGHFAANHQAMQDSNSDSTAVLAAARQLQSTGLALCSFGVPCMCNNPGCTSMTGLSELATVSRRSRLCAGCLTARYCGRACQEAAWKQHRPVCKQLRAAAAAAGGGGGG
jgi:hypothetical protein